ncbi:MAG: glycosyltransferase [Betaproteobacteria bacterium]|nr:glycosyltransferase [Betaproteobacteria bacterium]
MTARARTPRVAVLLPVYNGAKYIAEAVRSVLTQTFADFELIVIDDGSTDCSAEVLEGFSDTRLRVIRFSENRGLVAALNHGIRESRSELIARMDADDICMPTRFERQVDFLDSHPKVALCGTWTRQFGDNSFVRRPPVEAKQIRARMFLGWAMDHPSIMLRRSFLELHDLAYDDDFKHVEDFDLFLRAAELGDLANLPEILLRTRAHAEETSVVHEIEQVQTEALLLVRVLRKLMPEVTKEEEEFHLQILNNPVEVSDLPKVEQWLFRLDQINRDRGQYDADAFRHELRLQSYRLHAKAIGPGVAVLTSYWKSFLANRHEFGAREHAALAAEVAFIRLLGVARVCKKRLRRRQTGKLATKK